jgi:hypothetical protein
MSSQIDRVNTSAPLIPDPVVRGSKAYCNRLREVSGEQVSGPDGIGRGHDDAIAIG